MKVQLLVSEWCATCHQAERIWRDIAQQRDFDFTVLDMGQPEGKALVSQLRLKTVPALVIDGELKAIGVQSPQEALAFVATAPAKQASATQHIGLGMERSSRVAVLTAVAYLFLAGAALPLYGGFFAPGSARPAPLHVLTLGFLVFMIFGLGEHMLPRFTGNPIRLGRSAWLQQGLVHLGLWLFVTGFYTRVHLLIIIGGVLAWSGLLIFFLRLWPVLWPGHEAEPNHSGTAGIPLLRQ